MMVKNKKAWIRIVEAFIAVMIIAGVLLVVVSKQKPDINRDEEIYKIEKFVLEQVRGDKTCREKILNWNIAEEEKELSDEEEKENEKIMGHLKTFINNRKIIPSYFTYELKICEIIKMCALDEYIGDVYAQEIIISSTLQDYGPKKLKLFIWEE